MDDLALDYVSPLPPVRSGIADYSADLLPWLEPLCDLRVIRLPDQPVAEELIERWNPSPSRALGREGRLPLFHMGNNQYHEAVYALAMRWPGVLVLHDLVLHHFLLGSTLGRGEPDAYRRRLALEHGWLGEAAAAVVRWGALGDSLQFGLPAHRRLVRRQRGILVHSDWARQTLLEEWPDLAVRTIPMGIPLPERVAAERGDAFRERHGIPAAAPLLGSFGFQTPMKRPDVAVRAMSAPELAEVHLVIAGELAPTLELEALIEEEGVGERVHVTGFLEYAEFEAAIAACDLALNLRYPSAGETSAALLRVLALGRPTVVSEYAQFAELPAEAALRIPVGEGEVESLVRATSALLAEPKRLAAMGEAAREYVRRRHDPAAAAAAMVTACSELAPRRPPAPRPATPDEPTTLTWSRLRGTIQVDGLGESWPEGERRRLRVCLTNRGRARWLAGRRRPGGVVLRVTTMDERRSPLGPVESVPLPRPVGSGESDEVELELRRPLGRVRLRVEPRITGEESSRFAEGPRWESEI